MAETARFGLEKFGGPYGGAITDSGGKYSTGDRDVIDRLLSAFESHDHSADPATAAPLEDPSDSPTATVATTGGGLAGGTTYYYKVSYLDQFGLETAASDEVAATTGDVPTVTDPPVATGDSTAGNTLPPATYYYAVTGLSAQGETALGPQAIISIQPGQTGCLLTMPPMDNGITAYNAWRHGMSDAGWTKVGVNISGATFLDVGVPTGTCLTDPATQPPASVTVVFTGTNAVTVTVPDVALVGTLGGPVTAWRLYRTDTSGNYGTDSLVAQLVPADDTTPLVTSYTDLGGGLLTGQPLLVSSTLTPSTRLWSAGTTLPLATGFAEDALFLHRTEKALYAVIGGAWTKLAGANTSGGGGTGGGTAQVYAGNESYFSIGSGTDPVAIPVPAGSYTQISAPDSGLNIDNRGADLLVNPSYNPPAGVIAETTALYGIAFGVDLTGLDAGDTVQLNVQGASNPNDCSETFTVPAFPADPTSTRSFMLAAQRVFLPGAWVTPAVIVGKPDGSSTSAVITAFNFGLSMVTGPMIDITGKLPGIASDLAITRTGSTLDATWTASSTPGDSPIKDYSFTVASNDGQYTHSQAVTGTSATVTGVPAAKDLAVYLYARNQYGKSDAAQATVTLPPVALPYSDSFAYPDGELPAPYVSATDPAPTIANGTLVGGGAASFDVDQNDADITLTFTDTGVPDGINWLVVAAGHDMFATNVRYAFSASGSMHEFDQATDYNSHFGLAPSGGVAFTPFPGGSTTIRVVLQGTSLTVYQNGASLGTVTLPDAPSGTRVGFSLGNGTTADNLVVVAP
jgi:hypothetical protein